MMGLTPGPRYLPGRDSSGADRPGDPETDPRVADRPLEVVLAEPPPVESGGGPDGASWRASPDRSAGPAGAVGRRTPARSRPLARRHLHLGRLHLLRRRTLLGGHQVEFMLHEHVPDAWVVQVEEDRDRQQPRDRLRLDRRPTEDREEAEDDREDADEDPERPRVGADVPEPLATQNQMAAMSRAQMTWPHCGSGNETSLPTKVQFDPAHEDEPPARSRRARPGRRTMRGV